MNPITENRPLTLEEMTLIQWLLEHGKPQAIGYLPQLADAHVISRCACGCASIDFAIGEKIPQARCPLEILSDYEWQQENGHRFGVFAFAKAGILAGLEVWSVDGLSTASFLPNINRLTPIAVN